MFNNRKAFDAWQRLSVAREEAGQTTCEQYPDAWFPDLQSNSSYETRWAKESCKSCPIQRECLEYALIADEQHGIWGGMTTMERNALKRQHVIQPHSA